MHSFVVCSAHHLLLLCKKKNKNKETNIVNRKNEEKLQYNYINSIYNDHFEY